MTKTFSGCLPIWKIRSLFPNYSLSNFYGQPKLHKVSKPLRGLATAYDALVSNNENFLKILLKPIADKCSFLVKHTEFKERFLNDRNFFDPAIHRVMTVDIEQMHTYVNVVRCVSLILERIYTEPRKYFNFKGINGEIWHPQKKKILNNF